MNALMNPVTGVAIPDESLSSLKKLIDMQLARESDITLLEKKLDELKEQHRKLSQETIPDKMQELGLSELRTDQGFMVRVQKFYSAKIPDEYRDKAVAWLRQTGNDGIIKTALSMAFGKGEDREVQRVSKLLKRAGIEFEAKQSIHPQTLKAFVREMVESGKQISHQMFGIYIGNVTKIEVPE